MPIKITRTQDMVRDIIPEGMYEVLISGVKDTSKFNNFSNEQEDGIQVDFQLDDFVKDEAGEYKLSKDGEKMYVKAFNFYTPFLTVKSNLTKLFNAVFGRQLTVEEADYLDTGEAIHNFLINKKVNLIIKNTESAKGKLYYKITDYLTVRGLDQTPKQPYPVKVEVSDEEIENAEQAAGGKIEEKKNPIDTIEEGRKEEAKREEGMAKVKEAVPATPTPLPPQPATNEDEIKPTDIPF